MNYDPPKVPIEPGSPEWKERRDNFLLAELAEPERWFYMSFVNDTGFAGGIVTKARGPISAVQRTHQLGINPGGEVQIIEVPDAIEVTPDRVDRILSREELEAWV